MDGNAEKRFFPPFSCKMKLQQISNVGHVECVWMVEVVCVCVCDLSTQFNIFIRIGLDV